jgi:hypothetical protein
MDWALFVSDLISRIPDVVIGALLALAGVVLSNRSHTANLKRQLEHDAAQKAADRLAQLRREVYLSAAEELIKATTHLQLLPKMDLATVNPGEGLRGLFVAITRIMVVADLPTAYLASDVSRAYGSLLLKFAWRAVPIQQVNNRIRHRTEAYERAAAEVQRILSAMRQLHESGKSDAVAFEALKKSFEISQKLANDLTKERAVLWAQHSKLEMQFARESIPDHNDIFALHIRLLAAIRAEVGLDTEVEELTRRMEANRDRSLAELEAFMKRIEEASAADA